MSTEITKFAPSTLEGVLTERNQLDELLSICGKGDPAKGKTILMKELAFASQAASKNYQLQSASPQSIAASVYNTVVSGLSLNPQLELADIVPYDTSIKTATGWEKRKEAQMQPRYGGILKLCADTGAFRDAPFTACVYEGDEFLVTMGSNRTIHHIPKYLTSDPEKITHVYTIFSLANGGSHMEVMPASRIREIRGRSQSYKYAVKEGKENSVWHTDFPAMAMKTCLKRGLKTVPKSSFNMEAYAKLGAAIASDNTDYDSLPAPAKDMPSAQYNKLLDKVKEHPTEGKIAEISEQWIAHGYNAEQLERWKIEAADIVDEAQANQEQPIIEFRVNEGGAK